jgi:hypothetical protein
MPRYAKETTVPVERSRAEIEETVRRYGATKFNSGWDEDSNQAFVMFHIQGLFIRFTLPLPAKAEKRFTHKEVRGQLQRRTEQQQQREWEQEIRQRWRALLLGIKGKLESVECGISTVEKEFLAFIVMPNDQTLVEWLAKDALPSIRSGSMPQLGYKQEPQDAEFEVK